MHKPRFLVILCIIAILTFLMPAQVLAETELVFVEENILPVPEEVLEEIYISESISIQQFHEQIEWQIFALVNQERQRLGKPALQMDSVLRDICRSHSKDYGDNNLYDLYPDPPHAGHYSPTTGWDRDRLASRGYEWGVHYNAIAENYASNLGHSDPGAVAFNGWMNSPLHRDNIRDVNNRGYNYTGIGVYRASNGEYYFTQKFVTAPSPLSSIITPPTDPSPPTAPSVPTLVSPANGSTVAGSGTDSGITFQWNASSGADRYQMRLRYVGATDWIESGVTTETKRGFNNFPNDGRQYQWAVRAGNSAGQWSNWSSAWSFTNGTGTTPTPPPEPQPVYPADGSTVAGTSITFNWQPSPGATYYIINVWRPDIYMQFCSEEVHSGTTHTCTYFENEGVLYKWQVAAVNDHGMSDFAYGGSFINGPDSKKPVSPGIPRLRSPVHGEIIHGNLAALSWDPVEGATHYAVWVYNLTKNKQEVFSDPMTGTSATLTNLANNGDIYAWSVVASNANEGTWGDFATPIAFINGSAAALLPPTLVSPEHNTNVSGGSVTFSWAAPAGATHYAVWVYNLTKDELGIFSDPITNTSITLSGFPNNGDVYAWSVASSDIYSGTWSDFAYPRLFVND